MNATVEEIVRRTRGCAPVVARHVVRTPLQPLPGTELLIKAEHLQRSGSFKIRGAIATLAALGPAERDRGVVTASSGNHGLGVAHALGALGGTGTVFVPEGAAAVKVAAIRRLGVEVRHLGRESGETEVLTRTYAAEHGLTYISPYNDLDVVGGQGTIALELLAQAGGLDTVVVAVGGGGLVSGIAATLKAHLPGVRVIGAAPAADAAMAASVAAGHVVAFDARPTLSDGTAGSVEQDAITLGLCTELVDEWVLIEEDAIRAALRHVIDTTHQLVEGAAAVAIAAGMALPPGPRTAVVSCGGNISAATLATALQG